MADKEINYEILGRKVAILHPDIAERLNSSPKLTDVLLVSEIFRRVSETELSGNRYNFNHTHLIIGVILNLYDPDVLEGWKRNLCRGVRSQLALCFNVCDTAISNNIQTVRGYYLTYRKFKESVDYISAQISEEYSHT